MQLGVVVLTHGPSREFEALVRSLIEQGIAADSIVVAHNPRSETEPPLRLAVDGVQIVRTSGRRAYAGGMNSGVRFHLDRREVTHVLVLTRDVVLHKDAIVTLLNASTNAPVYGILGPTLWWPSENRPFSYGGFRTPSGKVRHYSKPQPRDMHGIVPCDWIDGAAMLVRAEVFGAAGFFDESFFMYYEETDLCLRAQRAGWQVGVVLDSVAGQEPGESSWPGGFGYLMSRNGLEFARRTAGARGVAAGFVRLAWERLWLAREQWRSSASSEERARLALRIAGMRRGAVDFIRGRWGPPPAVLGGLGDMADEGPTKS